MSAQSCFENYASPVLKTTRHLFSQGESCRSSTWPRSFGAIRRHLTPRRASAADRRRNPAQRRGYSEAEVGESRRHVAAAELVEEIRERGAVLLPHAVVHVPVASVSSTRRTPISIEARLRRRPRRHPSPRPRLCASSRRREQRLSCLRLVHRSPVSRQTSVIAIPYFLATARVPIASAGTAVLLRVLGVYLIEYGTSPDMRSVLE